MWTEKYNCDSNTVRVIGEFTILWCQFELLYFSNNANESKLLEFAQEHLLEVSYFENEYQQLKEAANKYLACIDQETIRHRIYSGKHRGNQEKHRHIISFLNDDAIDWVGCLLFIGRIRDNLFHGLKDVYTLNNQAEMIEAVCAVLDRLICWNHSAGNRLSNECEESHEQT